MPRKTAMVIYDGIVLQCHNCLRISMLRDIETRRSCPHCGLSVDMEKIGLEGEK